ncbi:small integral membrane protein 12 isoform X1 [Pteropus medius]|uniref:Small integral membrane protein 12 n=4 Tax=Laurasiatheria TaxID=314145 RepID=A0A6P3Q2Y5_PTEVA|nr:small integral membrane protein 12 isoform X1 [Pteropus vampyrus]XP_039707020.1 small integral membrane protein 12 isoform X1 [Pteropus giganteus]
MDRNRTPFCSVFIPLERARALKLERPEFKISGSIPSSDLDVMWPVLWTVVRTYAPYVTFPVAFVVGAVGYHLEWFIRGKDPQPMEEEKSISERREDRKLDELLGKDHTQVVSLKDKLEFAPKAVLNRNRPEKN